MASLPLRYVERDQQEPMMAAMAGAAIIIIDLMSGIFD
jgi:hypothetical protein